MTRIVSWMIPGVLALFALAAIPGTDAGQKTKKKNEKANHVTLIAEQIGRAHV